MRQRCCDYGEKKVDLGPLDTCKMSAIIMDKRHGVYHLFTKSGVTKSWFSCNEIKTVQDLNLNKDKIQNKIISLREVLSLNSLVLVDNCLISVI